MDMDDRLDHLLRIDLDAVRAYTQAIDNVADTAIRDMLAAFRADHERHVEDLSAEIVARGRQPPQTAHFGGFALAGFTGVAAGVAPAGALMAMQSNEVVTNQAYDMALAANGMPDGLRRLLLRNFGDEQRHLRTIRQWLRQSSPAGHMLSGSATAQGLGASLWLNVVRANPVATAVAATSAALLLGNYLLGRRGAARSHPETQPHGR